MDPTASTSVSSRFVTESSIVEAQERRKEGEFFVARMNTKWKKAYERLGQKPPEDQQGPPQVYDQRSLYEKLQEQKDSKQAAFDEKYSIRNQFRGVDDDEASGRFLDDNPAVSYSVLDDKKLAEKERQQEIDAELAKFRQAVSAKQTQTDESAASPPLPPTSGSPPASTTAPSAIPTASLGTHKAPPPKKSSLQQKGLLAGAIKRKTSAGEKEKRKVPAGAVSKSVVAPDTVDTDSVSKDSRAQHSAEEDSAPKKRKVEPSS
ncbi:MAG: hypothetical protein CYPHOPRED_005942 [Cyphobasidiales sp. Tagirdzhanova-0007]|nr:MAG: hypothetical protein CYPHOPRED_005942 [Cyphobasidiales sp. Tagirdzhanova-0007]